MIRFTTSRKTLAQLTGTLILCLSISSASADQKMDILSFDYMPYVGQGGFLNHLAESYCHEHNKQCHFLELPVARSIALYGSEEAPFILGSVVMLPEEKQAISRLHPISHFYNTALYLEDEHTANWADISYDEVRKRQLRVGMLRGMDDEHSFFNGELGLTVFQAGSFEQLIKMLISKRIDLISGTIIPTFYAVEQNFPEILDRLRYLSPYYKGVGGLVYIEGSSQQDEDFFTSLPHYQATMEEFVGAWPQLNPADFMVKTRKDQGLKHK